MNFIQILPAKPKDVESIYQVRKFTWLDTYPNKQLNISKENILEKFTQIEKNFEKYIRERKERLRKK